MSEAKTEKKLTGGIVAIVILALCLTITTFALVYATVSVDNNLFHTGEVKINLNDGNPVIYEHEFLFEPGMTVKKEFFIENESTWAVYYKIYFDDIEAVCKCARCDRYRTAEKVLYSGKVNELTRHNVTAADDTLEIGQRRNLTVFFHFPEAAGNEAQNLRLSFTLCAEATQTKNNPYRLFD